jgi:hypothetical protein
LIFGNDNVFHTNKYIGVVVYPTTPMISSRW